MSTDCHHTRGDSANVERRDCVRAQSRDRIRGVLASLLLLGVFTAEGSAAADELRVAAASDLQFALRDLSVQFQKKTGHTVSITYGSSGNFYSQIENGAPFDLFFSADIEYPRKLESVGLAEPRTLYKYALGRIVIWIPGDAKLDLAKLKWNTLVDPAVQKIAIANPAHAPYGRAAVAALKTAGIYEKVATKLVYGENISQAAQFVESGNAQAGIVALSLALSPAMRDKGKRWEIPAQAHPPIEQAVIILRSSTKKETARVFLDFVKSQESQKILASYGFQIPLQDDAAGGRK